MNLSAIFESAVCGNLVWSLVHFVWQGTVVGAATTFAMVYLRRRSPQSRYLVCTASLLVMLVCMPVTFAILLRQDADTAANLIDHYKPSYAGRVSNPAPEIALLEALEEERLSKLARTQEVTSNSSEDASGIAALANSNDSPGPAESMPGAGSPERNNNGATDWPDKTNHVVSAVTVAYFLGVLLMAGRLFVASCGVQRLRRGAVAVSKPELLTSISSAANKLELHKVPMVAFVRRVSSPVVIGFIRPMILLPVNVTTGLSLDQFTAVLSHELAHIRRHDHIVLIFQRVVEALLFFHPAVWLISRWIRIERESCCDEAVLAAGTRRNTYVESLLRVAELRLLEQRKGVDTLAALTAVDDPSQLRRRISRLLGEPIEPVVQLTRMGALAACLLIGIGALSPLALQSRAGQPTSQITEKQPEPSPQQPKEPQSLLKPAKEKDASKLAISRETTFVSGPLTGSGFVDFRAAINQRFSKGVTSENNVVVPLMQAIGPRPENLELPDEFFDRLGIARLPEEGEYFTYLYQYTQDLAKNSKPPKDFDALWKDIEQQLDRALEGPWRAKDFPIIDSWLKQNEKPLSTVVEGTKRTRYYYPWVAADNEPLFAQMLPGVQTQREVARKLSMRANLKIGEGDLDGAWEDLKAMHRLARLLSEGPTLIDMLIGIAVDSIACQGTDSLPITRN